MSNNFYYDVARDTSLNFDEQTKNLSGTVDGYKVTLNPTTENKALILSFSVAKDGALPNMNDIKQLFKHSSPLQFHGVSRYRVSFYIKHGLTKSKTRENIEAALHTATKTLSENKYQNICQNCGINEKTAVYNMQGNEKILCESCFSDQSTLMEITVQTQQRKKENVLTGIVGALLGSLIGVFIIVLLGQLGYVASVSGLVMAVATVKGYELFGRKFSKEGAIISILVILVMVYAGNRLDWAISVAAYIELDIFSTFRALPLILKSGDLTFDYYKSLAMVYLFSLLGAIPTIISAFKNSKKANLIYKISE